MVFRSASHCQKSKGLGRPCTYTLNWIVVPLYNGDAAKPIAPKTAVTAPHLAAPTRPPLLASQAATLASSFFIAS